MIIRTGNWAGVNRMLNVAKLSLAIEKQGLLASNRAGLVLTRAIMKQIRATNSPPNSPLTIARKGSSSPLQDSSAGMGASVTHIVMAPLIVWVGIPKSAKHKDSGVSYALIAEVLNGGQFGRMPKDTVIRPRNAKRLFVPLKKDVEPFQSGLKRNVDFILMDQVRIRARPFLDKAVKKAQGKIILIYEAATIAAFRSLIRG